MVQWIFFDIGDTLVNEEEFESAFLRKVYRILSEKHTGLSNHEFLRSVNDLFATRAVEGFPDLVKHLEKEYPKTRPLLSKLYREDVQQMLEELGEPYPDTLETLRILSKNHKLGVIANQYQWIRRSLRRWGITDYIEVYAISSEIGVSKPDEQIFLHALSQAGITSEEATMVGDRLDNDIGPANKLGMTTIRVKQGIWKNLKPEDKHEIPDHETSNLLEILRLPLGQKR